MKDLGHLSSGEQITKACYLASTLDGAIDDGLYGMDTISQWPALYHDRHGHTLELGTNKRPMVKKQIFVRSCAGQVAW